MYKVKVFVTLKESVVDPAGDGRNKRDYNDTGHLKKLKRYGSENILN